MLSDIPPEVKIHHVLTQLDSTSRVALSAALLNTRPREFTRTEHLQVVSHGADFTRWAISEYSVKPELVIVAAAEIGDMTLCAFINRQFPNEADPNEVYEYGEKTIECFDSIVQLYPSYDPTPYFGHAARAGDLNLMRALCDKVHTTCNKYITKVYTDSISNGHLHLLKYYYNLGIPPIRDDLTTSINYCWREITEWIIDKLGVQYTRARLGLNQIPDDRRLEFTKWMHQQGYQMSINAALSAGSIPTVDYLLSLGFVISNDDISSCIRTGGAITHRWVADRALTTRDVSNIVTAGDLEAVNRLLMNGHIITPVDALRSGRLDIIKMVEFTDKTILKNYQVNSLEILQYLHEVVGCKMYEPTSPSTCPADVVEYIHAVVPMSESNMYAYLYSSAAEYVVKNYGHRLVRQLSQPSPRLVYLLCKYNLAKPSDFINATKTYRQVFNKYGRDMADLCFVWKGLCPCFDNRLSVLVKNKVLLTESVLVDESKKQSAFS